MVFLRKKYFWKEEYVHTADVGNHYCVNPYLYTVMTDILEKESGQVDMVDVGAGSCSLAEDFMQGATYLPPYLNERMKHVQKKVSSFTCIEQDPALLAMNVTRSSVIKKVEHACTIDDVLPFTDSSIDLVTSRHFIMHLDIPAMQHHIDEVTRVLKPGGKYLMVCLSPEYEVKKSGMPLKNGYRYLFPKSSGPVEHYFKTSSSLHEIVSASLTISQRIPCYPTTNKYKTSKPHFYDMNCPMAYFYIITK